jgi:hypothetical protein
MNDIVDWVANQGFAIAIAVYLLTRIETKLDKVITSLEKVYNEIRDQE